MKAILREWLPIIVAIAVGAIAGAIVMILL